MMVSSGCGLRTARGGFQRFQAPAEVLPQSVEFGEIEKGGGQFLSHIQPCLLCLEVVPCVLPFAQSLKRTLIQSIAIMLGLVRPFHRHAEIVGLFPA